jgi:peptidoglycan-associated lipoprotein
LIIHHSSRRVAAIAFATVLVVSGCHKKVVPPPKAALSPAPPAPRARITVNPLVIESGQSATLTWTTTNADKVTIAGLGAVAVSGTRSVAPMRSADYTVTATAANGVSVQDTARLTVNRPAVAASSPAAPAAEMTEEQLFAQNVHDVFFDYDKYALRSSDETTAERDAAFLKNHPEMKVIIEGHCDDRGSEEYNLALGESRAESLKKALVQEGVDASRIQILSDGEEKPFCDVDNDSCWQENRRDHLKLASR